MFLLFCTCMSLVSLLFFNFFSLWLYSFMVGTAEDRVCQALCNQWTYKMFDRKWRSPPGLYHFSTTMPFPHWPSSSWSSHTNFCGLSKWPCYKGFQKVACWLKIHIQGWMPSSLSVWKEPASLPVLITHLVHYPFQTTCLTCWKKVFLHQTETEYIVKLCHTVWLL